MSFRERRKKWQDQAANWLEIPKDIALDLPKITVIGNVQAFVENHRGILEYTPELIRIKVSTGQMVIKGKDLFLRNILMHEILVEGAISGIEIKELR
ncbi:MAG TPA: sporulation protein YqfC [Bacillota bacterium]|nr:sporulation protein YqfC [Bacillota bacterium]